ncbi:MAG: lyase family protein, partial [Anaerolineales bacterium]|nr:lyase family protein [Anaerolineales bacterium]
MTDTLHALSPLDGRYAEMTAPLSGFFSEFAFLRDRVRVELDFLAALSKTGIFRPLSDSESAQLESIKLNFSSSDAESIQAHERQTRHDVKAIEYFLQEKLRGTSLEDLLSWLHFGMTSEDTNSLGLALALKESRDTVILPNLQSLISNLSDFALRYKSIPMLARTHGQFAVPTTVGKEFAVYIARLKKIRNEISAFRFEAKLTGAVG